MSTASRVVVRRYVLHSMAVAAIVSGLPSMILAEDGAALYKESCLSCHDAGLERAPTRSAFRAMTPERVLAAMETGPMISMASFRTGAERRAIAEFVTGKAFGASLDLVPSPQAMCRDGVKTAGTALWNGWGQNPANTRFQSASMAGLSAAQVPLLKLKWAFGFPGDLTVEAQPSLADGSLYIGSQTGRVYSFNAATGCTQWTFDATAAVRTAISTANVGSRPVVFFGAGDGAAYSLDAATGKLRWKTKVDESPVAHITGSPVFHNGRLYVPVASGEEGAAASPDYECCRFRGSVVALDAVGGGQVWKTFTIAEEAHRTRRNKRGIQSWGPSGAPVWTSPTIDVERNALYVTTGDNYSDPTTSTSDAFLAMNLDSGKLLWSRQMTSSDAYNVACRIPDKTNCPDSNGPDLDFGSSPILVSLPGGRRALIAGQKSGIVHALDPDRGGEILWQVRVGQGGSLGGVQWGSAADRGNVYVALSDIGRVLLPFGIGTDADPKRGGGMFALKLDNGERMWYMPPPGCGDRKRCSPAQSAAVSAIPGAVFSGSVDGHMRAYSTANGSIIWDFDAVRPFQTVNRVPGRGGSLDGPGPIAGGGVLYFVSGYAKWGGEPGNVLLAFSVDGK